jgi:FixJ family two-component response regulator
MTDAKPTVLVIDDDPDLRVSIARLLRSLDIETRVFASIPDFAKSNPTDAPTCLVLDVRLPGQSGLDLQRDLAAAHRKLPIIFITGHGDIPMTVQAEGGRDRVPGQAVSRSSWTPLSWAWLAIAPGGRARRPLLRSRSASAR